MTAVTLSVWAAEASVPRKLDFNRDVRPILSDRCFHCHGPDAKTREAGLRLDTQKGALADLGGYQAVVPGHPDKSELHIRITTKDPDDLMPPPDSGKKLSPDEVAVLKRWIEQGANWQPHWSFTAPEKPAVPAVKNASWIRNPVDLFVLARLEEAGLPPAPEASREALIRRVTLDLTGLPPTPVEVDAFLADRRPDAYERVVDHLLGSTRYGEQQARIWLDAVRYGDTHGLHYDNKRSIWPYRDWVVRAFNSNLPFDRFTVEQLAGDLLPAPTREQRTATGFLRCNMTTNEGGLIAEEAKVHLVRDRVEAFSAVWLGLTTGCAACHDHKYDPLSQKDFYQLSAYFDNGLDTPLDGNAESPLPFLRLGTVEQDKALAGLDKEIGAIDREIQAKLEEVQYEDPLTEAALAKLEPTERVWDGKTPLLVNGGDKLVIQVEPGAKLVTVETKVDETVYRADKLVPKRGRLEVTAGKLRLPVGKKIHSLTVTGGHVVQLGVRSLAPEDGKLFDSLLLWETLEERKSKTNMNVPDPLKAILGKARKKRTEKERRLLRDHFFVHACETTRAMFAPLNVRRAPLDKQRQALDETIPRTLVFEDKAERKPSHVLVRGEYDHHGDEVAPATPAVLPPPPAGTPANRLGLARWLVDPNHPLTARVTVNRFWQQHFGNGLVKTSWDFGVQGEWPSHPELLDWLAVTFVEARWDSKALQRLMVTSAAYRQDVTSTARKRERDPENRLLSRGPRFRLDAEVLRDQALAVSGLLVDKLGGPGVRPYEPGDLWKEVAFPRSNTGNFKPDSGEALYRRSLYTFWKRTSPPPAMITFDAPSREYCTIRRERTNTPLQALVLMNDPQFVEASRKLAERILREGGATPEARIAWAFKVVTARRPDADEQKALRALFEARSTFYGANSNAADALLKVGDSPAAALPKGELAAWTMVSSAILNLDEAITN